MLSIDPEYCMSRARSMFDEVAGNFAKLIVLFGSGQLGRLTLRGLRSINIEPLAFVDNNPSLWRHAVDGLGVLSPGEAAVKFGDKAVFVVTIYNGSVTRRQLKAMNCKMIVPFAFLFWKYPDAFLPHGALDFPHRIFADANNVRKVLSLWADETSRREYVAQVRWHVLLDFESLPTPLPAEETYFPSDLISFRDDEVFVDCGAFDGDVIKTFLQSRGDKFKSIVALEPDPENFRSLQKHVSTLDEQIKRKISLRGVAVAAQAGKLPFDSTGTVASSAGISGTAEVDGVPLSEILLDHEPSFIKMDIEGAELDALSGARSLIEKGSAVWAVCVYHRQADLWEIPLFINSISDKYRLFLRRYAEECWESICYAIPSQRLSGKCKGQG